MQSASGTPSSHSRRAGAQPERALWALLVAERRSGAGRTGAKMVVAIARVLSAAGAPDRYHERKRDTPVHGLIGALISPMIIACVFAFAHIYRDHYLASGRTPLDHGDGEGGETR